MQADPYHFVYTSEIFQKTNCIWHENSLLDFLRSILISRGYTPKNKSRKSWIKQDQTVITCLVDDFATCADSHVPDSPYLFDTQTLILTDNHLNCPSQYQVFQLPVSFFGMYSYQPETIDYDPTKRFSLSVNRIDIKRISILLEIVRHSLLYYPEPTKLDLINCNFLLWNDNNDLETDKLKNFNNVFNNLPDDLKQRYNSSFSFIHDNINFFQHQKSLEQMSSMANLNIVLETYSGENNIALSEKIFRALQSPFPWMVYAGRHTVAYLQSIGFDVLADIIPHRYDRLSERDKIVEFVAEAAHVAFELSKIDNSKLHQRCMLAAVHNQSLLAEFRLQWPSDFAKWFADVSSKL